MKMLKLLIESNQELYAKEEEEEESNEVTR